MSTKACLRADEPPCTFSWISRYFKLDLIYQNYSLRNARQHWITTTQMLRAVGVSTCEDLYEKRGELRLLFSEISHASFLRDPFQLNFNRKDLSCSIKIIFRFLTQWRRQKAPISVFCWGPKRKIELNFKPNLWIWSQIFQLNEPWFPLLFARWRGKRCKSKSLSKPQISQDGMQYGV